MKDEGPSLWAIVVGCTGSVAAALVTSQVWVQGTLLTAAITPVIVALVSELLHGAGRSIGERMRVPFRARIAILTAIIALVVGVSLLTAPKLIAGESLKDVSRGTTIFADSPKQGSGGGGETPIETDPTATGGPDHEPMVEVAPLGPTPVDMEVVGEVKVSNPSDESMSLTVEIRDDDGSPTSAADDFMPGEECGSLAPHASCAITLRFRPGFDAAPEKATKRTALLAVTHMETGRTQTPTLVGEVAGAP